MLNSMELTGRARTHVVQFDGPRFAAHPVAAEAFLRMRAAAARDGIDLLPFSAFRDFHTQCRIWNKKFLGAKPLYDAFGQPRDYGRLSADEVIDCILNWSALPGASRHHWGTEIDVVDGARVPPGYHVQLLPPEVEPGGIFHDLHRWLDKHIGSFGFFRPYAEYRGGMYREPWHLSYAPVSVPAMGELTPAILIEALTLADLAGKELLLARIDKVFERHVRNIQPAPLHLAGLAAEGGSQA